MRTKIITIPRLISAREFFRLNPDGRLSTGLWDDPVWTRATFQRWLLKCIHKKINREMPDVGRKRTQEYQGHLRRDAGIIRDAMHRVRRTGTNILSTPEMKRRYPHIDNPPREEW